MTSEPMKQNQQENKEGKTGTLHRFKERWARTRKERQARKAKALQNQKEGQPGRLQKTGQFLKTLPERIVFFARHHWSIFAIAVIVVIAVLVHALWPILPIPITLHLGIFSTSYWQVPESSTYQVVDQVIERFEQEHPYIHVKYTSGIIKDDYSQWLAQQILQGTLPDVFMVLDQDFNLLASLGALYDLDGLIEKDPSIHLQDYYQPAIESGLYDHTLYALPYQCNLKLMFVNQTLLEKENIPLPDPSWTINDFLAICEQVTRDTNQDGVMDQFGQSGYGWDDTMEAYGLELVDESGNNALVNNNQVKSAVQFMRHIRQYEQTSSDTQSVSGFDAGNCVFAPMSLAEYKTYAPYPWKVRKYSAFDWTMLPMPALADGQASASLDSLMMSISSRSTHPQKAWELLRMFVADPITQQQVMSQTGGLSPIRAMQDGAMDGQDLSWDLVSYALEHSRSKNRFKKFEEASSLVSTGVEEMIRTNTDLDLALLDLQKQLNTLLHE